jgi:hypothetical protein
MKRVLMVVWQLFVRCYRSTGVVLVLAPVPVAVLMVEIMMHTHCTRHVREGTLSVHQRCWTVGQ